MKACYANCPNKAALKLHCRRNAGLYQGYEASEVSGRGVVLSEFVAGVEEIDFSRKPEKVSKEESVPKWIDPRSSSQDVKPHHPLWSH